jgi:hypothetical protein
MTQPATDLDAMRRALAQQGHFAFEGATETSCMLSFIHKDGRVYTEHRATEADCILAIHKRVRETML